MFPDPSQVKAVHRVRTELLDEMERRTGHRSKTLVLFHVSGHDKEAAARRLLKFSGEVQRRCAWSVEPPYDVDPDWVNSFEKLVNSDRSLQRQPTAPDSLGANFREAP